MIGPLRPKQVKFQKPLITSWDTWRKGLNTLLRETEIDGQEMTVAQNLLLVGMGIPTKRWGSTLAFQAGASNASINGVTRFVLPIKDNNDNRQVIAWTDSGYLSKQSGLSYTRIQGASWVSGYNMEGVQLNNQIYLVNGKQPLVRYDFNQLYSFATISPPTAVTATNLSGVTGTNSFSWKVTALSPVGETLPSNAVSLSTLPLALNTTIRVGWTATTPGAGATLVGYNIYRGLAGEETWIGGVGSTVTSFDDNIGYPAGGGQNYPLTDTTSGPTAKWILRFQNRLILAGLPGFPTRILISAVVSQEQRFDFLSGGGFLDIDPNSGEDITGLGIYYKTITATQTIIVTKERSVWEVVLGVLEVGNYAVLNPTYRLLTASQGSSSHRSIIPVENDVYFVNTRGVYILRYEPQLYGVINANELSAKIRPFFQNLSYADISQSAGFYADKKYVISFPTSQQALCFDRERLSFTGPWKFPWNVSHWGSYIDGAGMEHWLAASNSNNNVYEFSRNLSSDYGVPIATSFRTKKDTFGDWTLFKTISEIFMNFRNLSGTVQVNIYTENRSGTVVSSKSFTMVGTNTTGSSGMGTDQLGSIDMGDSANLVTTVAGEIQKKAIMYKTARAFQIEVITNGATDNYEFLNVKAISVPQSRGNNPSAWNV